MLNVGLSVYRKEDWSKVTYIGVSLLWPRQAIRTTLNFKLLRADPDSRQHLGISQLIPSVVVSPGQLTTTLGYFTAYPCSPNWSRFSLNLFLSFIYETEIWKKILFVANWKDWYTHRKVKFFRPRNASASILWILLERKPLLKTTQS